MSLLRPGALLLYFFSLLVLLMLFSILLSRCNADSRCPVLSRGLACRKARSNSKADLEVVSPARKRTRRVETYEAQGLTTSRTLCSPSAEDTGAVEGDGRMISLVCQDLLVDITANPLEVISMSHDVGITVLVEDSVVFDAEIDPFVPVQDCVESRECIMTMNSCTDGGVCGVVGGE
jgi:hypothetical protein